MRLLICLTALLLGLTSAPSPLSAASPNLSPSEAGDLIRKEPGVFLLDVRTPGEFLDTRIAGARLIPIDQLPARTAEIPKDRSILVYCAVGYRSSNAVRFLLSRGYKKVYNLYGGIWAWQLAGQPVTKGPP